MSTLTPCYRLRVYAPYSSDASETTLLTPAAAAPHADAFQVASIRGVSGYQPYLYPPQGRRGGFDVLTKRVDTGEMTFDLFDVRTPSGSNAQRWVTAFAGDAGGRPALLNCRVEVDESLDGGTTWDRFFTGRVETFSFADVLVGTLTVRDESERLEEEQFVGRPHANATYARAAAVLPVQGPVPHGADYRRLGGTVAHTSGEAEFFRVTIEGTATNTEATKKQGNVLSIGLTDRATRTEYSTDLRHDTYYGALTYPSGPTGDARLERSTVRALISWSGGSGEYPVYYVRGVRRQDSGHYYHVREFQCGTYPAGLYGTSARPADAASVTIVLIADGPASADAPLHVGPVDPLDLWQDLLAGKFSRLADDGTVRRTFPADTAAFTALAATRSFLPLTAKLEKPMPAREFVEDFILKPYHLGYRLSAVGEVVPFDCRRDSSLASATSLTNDDAAPLTGGRFRWTQGRGDAISRITTAAFRDFVPHVSDLVDRGARPILDAAAGIIESSPLTIVDRDLSDRALDVVGRAHEVEAPGWRARHGWWRASQALNILAFLRPSSKDEEAIIAAAIGTATQLRALFGAGGTTLERTFRRASAGDVYPGMWRRLSIDEAPNAASYVRGGERLGFCIDRVEDGPFVGLTFLDGGAESVAVVPTLATLAVSAGVPTVTVTRNAAGDRVLLEVALTTQAVAVAPTIGWLDAGVATADGVFTLPVAPAGMRLWVRGRSESEATAADFQLPSAFVAPTPAFIDTGTITAPSAVAVTAIGKTLATVSWTVGDATAVTEISVALGSFSAGLFDAPGLVVAILPAGSTSYRLSGLDGPSVAHTVGVRHVVAGTGRFSSVATADFTTGTTDAQLPTPLGLKIVSGF